MEKGAVLQFRFLENPTKTFKTNEGTLNKSFKNEQTCNRAFSKNTRFPEDF